MISFIVRRLIHAVVLVAGILSITFVIIQLTGDPSAVYLKPEIDPETLANIRRQMGLDQPIWQQYFFWLREVVSGNFGVSHVHHRPVAEIFAEAIPNTLRLTVVVFFFQLIVGVGVGVVTAVKRHTKLTALVNAVLLFFYSMPGFWLALIAIMVFSLKLGWLPASQMQSFYEVEGFWPVLWDRIRHLILPTLVLSIPFIAYTARFVRGSMTELLAQDFIRTAVAYGLSKYQIFFKYTLKNAVLPLITLIGLYLPFLLGGAVIIEYIFAWPGMGRVTVNAIFSFDYPVILASNFIAAVTVVAGNLFSDLLYGLFDPRIRV